MLHVLSGKFSGSHGDSLRLAAATLGARGGGVGLTFVVHLYLASTLGSATYGAYSSLLAISRVLAVVAGLGLPLHAIKNVPTLVQYGDKRGLAAYYRTCQSLTICCALLVAAAMALPFLADAEIAAGSSTALWLVALFTVLPLTAMVNLNVGVTSACGLPQAGHGLYMVGMPVMVAAGLLAHHLFYSELLLHEVIWITVCSLLTICLGYEFLISRSIASGGVTSWRDMDLPSLWKQRRAVSPLWLASLGEVAQHNAILVLPPLFFAATDNGAIAFAARMAFPLLLVSTTMTSVYGPSLRRSVLGNDIVLFRTLYSRVVFLNVITTGVIYCIPIVIYLVFGTAYLFPFADSFKYYLIIGATITAVSAAGPSALAFSLIENNRGAASSSALTVSLSVTGLMIGCVASSASGAVTGYGAGLVAGHAIAVFNLRRKLRSL